MKLAGFSEPWCHTTASRGSKGVGKRVEECFEGIRERKRWGWNTAIRTSFSSCDVNGDQMKCFFFSLVSLRPCSSSTIHQPSSSDFTYICSQNLATSAFVRDADGPRDGRTSFQVTVQSDWKNMGPNIQLASCRIKIILRLITRLVTQAYSSQCY